MPSIEDILLYYTTIVCIANNDTQVLNWPERDTFSITVTYQKVNEKVGAAVKEEKSGNKLKTLQLLG